MSEMTLALNHRRFKHRIVSIPHETLMQILDEFEASSVTTFSRVTAVPSVAVWQRFLLGCYEFRAGFTQSGAAV